jgi:hypothetical protein
MARRYLQLAPGEWLALSWAMQQAYLEGFYAEDLLKRPEPAPLNADMTVPDDIRSLTAAGSGYRAVEAAPAFDIGAMIADLEGKR